MEQTHDSAEKDDVSRIVLLCMVILMNHDVDISPNARSHVSCCGFCDAADAVVWR
jgi:hypothetical protein